MKGGVSTLLYLFLQDRVLGSPSLPQTHFTAEAGLEFQTLLPFHFFCWQWCLLAFCLGVEWKENLQQFQQSRLEIKQKGLTPPTKGTCKGAVQREP